MGGCLSSDGQRSCSPRPTPTATGPGERNDGADACDVQCVICLDDVGAACAKRLPCCGVSGTSTRICLPCLQRTLEASGRNDGVGKCPLCRALFRLDDHGVLCTTDTVAPEDVRPALIDVADGGGGAVHRVAEGDDTLDEVAAAVIASLREAAAPDESDATVAAVIASLEDERTTGAVASEHNGAAADSGDAVAGIEAAIVNSLRSAEGDEIATAMILSNLEATGMLSANSDEDEQMATAIAASLAAVGPSASAASPRAGRSEDDDLVAAVIASLSDPPKAAESADAELEAAIAASMVAASTANVPRGSGAVRESDVMV